MLILTGLRPECRTSNICRAVSRSAAPRHLANGGGQRFCHFCGFLANRCQVFLLELDLQVLPPLHLLEPRRGNHLVDLAPAGHNTIGKTNGCKRNREQHQQEHGCGFSNNRKYRQHDANLPSEKEIAAAHKPYFALQKGPYLFFVGLLLVCFLLNWGLKLEYARPADCISGLLALQSVSRLAAPAPQYWIQQIALLLCPAGKGCVGCPWCRARPGPQRTMIFRKNETAPGNPEAAGSISGRTKPPEDVFEYSKFLRLFLAALHILQ